MVRYRQLFYLPSQISTARQLCLCQTMKRRTAEPDHAAIHIHIGSHWRNVLDVATLRQDRPMFHLMARSVPAVGRMTLATDAPLTLYFVQRFDEVKIEALPPFYNRTKYRLEWLRKGRCHGDGVIPARITVDRTIVRVEWFDKGRRHRDHNLPAVVHWCSYRQMTLHNEWWAHGQRHRDDDKPAVHGRAEMLDNLRNRTWAEYKEWWWCGKRHRDGDAPAGLYLDGARTWFRHGQAFRDGNRPVYEDPNGKCVYMCAGKMSRSAPSEPPSHHQVY